MCAEEELEIEEVTIEDHLSQIAQLIDGEVSNFAEQHGKSILNGEALPAEAAAQLAQLAKDCGLLVRAVEALLSRSS
jgi:hypothetical protein